MKNTLIPLDIIWINKNKEIVFISHNTQPCKETCVSINPNSSALYVLEINANLSNQYDFGIKDKVKLNL